MIVPVTYSITLESLSSYYKSHWSELNKEKKGNVGRNSKEAAELGHSVYSRALSKGLGIAIIGPNRLREDEVLVGNFGRVVGSLSRVKVKKISEDLSYQHSGAILAEKQWSGIINDLYMLGSVHANKEFHFSLPKNKKLTLKDIWDSEQRCLTTIGRELLLLLKAKYAKACLNSSLEKVFGHVFVPPPEGTTTPVTLEEYREAIKTFRDPQKILSFFQEKMTIPEKSSCEPIPVITSPDTSSEVSIQLF